MIYTIRCRLDCGARFETNNRTPLVQPNEAVERLGNKALAEGWLEHEEGWLCPFHAPKPAPIPNTAVTVVCYRDGCFNASISPSHEVLLTNGWHHVRKEPECWICQNCWIREHVEPAAPSNMNVEHVARRVANDEIKSAFRRISESISVEGSYPLTQIESAIQKEAEVPF